MRPKKQMNRGGDGTIRRPVGKSRYFATPPPQPGAEAPADEPAGAGGDGDRRADVPRLLLPDGTLAPRSTPDHNVAAPGMGKAGKYLGRASVGPTAAGGEDLVVDLTEPMEWVDPLDDESMDLQAVTIDLRSGLRDDPPDTFYQRYVSKIPGRTPS